MFNFHKDLKMLMIVAGGLYLVLVIFAAIIPANELSYVEPLPTAAPLSDMERKGLDVFVSEGCVACHTQQVRNIEMDNMWGKRPSIPSDYYYDKQRMGIWRQSPSVLGSERTGPDLTNIGTRQPSQAWHLLHLYNPRSVSPASIMPSYPWMFEARDTSKITDTDVVLNVPEEFFNVPGKKVVAKPKALQLVAYLKSLKQAPMPGTETVEFIPASKVPDAIDGKAEGGSNGLDGKQLYISTCAACHQQAGTGLAGAFPPLAGSAIVTDKDPKLMIQIILQGYDARSEYAVMPPFAAQLSDEEIAAIATHERSSWGNDAPPITAEDVKKVREYVMELNK
ncbi:MAG TPA: cbb3-type cytochrome c oxidase subunit II [Salinimicrobium sp.]|nr:cbb3-type cytochrome c oxidase subunit II [Salinimicrobium sp.]